MKQGTFKRILLLAILLPAILFGAILLVAYYKQDAIVQHQIESLNQGYQGKVQVGDVHLAPFKNFPYISLKIDDVSVFETKEDDAPALLDVADIYIGVSFWDLLSGKIDIKSLVVEDGFFDIVLHEDGRTNLQNALATSSTTEEGGEPLKVHLQKIELINLDIHQKEEATQLDIETFIYQAEGGFKTNDEVIEAHIDSEFELNVIKGADTTFFKHKHFEFHTDLTFNKESGLLAIRPSGITMEHGDFEISGTIDTKHDMTVDLALNGAKPNFNLFIAFAPTELIPVLEQYENAGNIYFNASIVGPTTNGQQPFIDAIFGANDAFLENTNVKRRVDEMGFSGHFTNGEGRSLETMEFSITDISANLEKGKFIGNIVVSDFTSPEIDVELDADFEIPFIVSFLNLSGIVDPSGSVEMKLKFHDIIDLNNPEKALNELNQAYFAELIVKDLNFKASQLPAELKDLDAHLEMNGKKAELDLFELNVGGSDLSIKGYVSDLPAIIHHTPKPVKAHMEIASRVLDVAQLTGYSAADSTGFDERVEDLSLSFSFNALGNAFTEYKHLPKGEFFVDDLYAELKHYPHILHDFHADVIVKDYDLNIIDFTGYIDESDFHFNGLIHDYSFWMQDELNGHVDLDITLKSDLLQFDNLFSYQGENYVPEDYRHEEIEKFVLHMGSSMTYEDHALKAIDIQLDELSGKMHVHPLKFEDFSGRFHYEEEHIQVQKFHGQLGKTVFDIDMNYYLGEDEAIKKRDNSFTLKSDYIDFDALTNFKMKETPPSGAVATEGNRADKKHEEAFNLYELPFTDMEFNVNISHFIYHRLDLRYIVAKMRTTQDHFIYLDTLRLFAAGGTVDMNGYFNGSDPEHIYLKPHLKLTNVDLDKLLFKFENFGQDEVVSDNIHGQLNTTITGNIRVYPDMVPVLDQSEIHMDVEILNGRLENYSPVMMLSDYFGDKNLESIRFDTLQNHMDFDNGKLTVPNMTIASTLGHMDISGSQDVNNNIDYYVRIPWSLVKQAARNKLFGNKKADSDQEDEIIELDPNKKTRYLNINVSGTYDDYRVKVKKQKKKE